MRAKEIGFYLSVVMTILTLVTFVIAFLTPPVSGPLCTESCLEYPYLGAISRFPRDYYWMVPAILLSVAHVVLLGCLHDVAKSCAKVFSRVGLIFGAMAAGVLIVTYFTQLSVMQPSLVRGEHEGLAILSQYNAHGLFIALEEIGYLMMSLSFLFVAPMFEKPGRIERALRWIFVGNFSLALISFVAMAYAYGLDREYRFELAVISINWLSLIFAGPLLAVFFRREIPAVAKNDHV